LAQDIPKIEQKKYGILFKYTNGEIDSLLNDDGHKHKLYKYNDSYFVITNMGNFHIVGRLGFIKGKMIFLNSVFFKLEGNCLSLSDWASFKIVVNKNGLTYKFRRDRRKIKGVFPYKEYIENNILKISNEHCNDKPFVDF